MKTLYSSTFLSAILAFLALLGNTGTPVMVVQDAPTPSFQTILEPIGPALAPTDQAMVSVEVFNTFACRACDLFGQGVLPQLVEKYAENDEVEFRLYLVPDRESDAELYAVRGAHCASKYELFWDLTYKMHAAQDLSKREVDLLGQEIQLPVVEFRKCIGSEEFDEQIGQDIAYSETRKISQKPIILVNDTVLLGHQPIENIDLIINKYLNH